MPPKQSPGRKSSRSSSFKKRSLSSPSGIQTRQGSITEHSPPNLQRIRTDVDFGHSNDLPLTYSPASDGGSWTSKLPSDYSDAGDNPGQVHQYSSHLFDSPPLSPASLYTNASSKTPTRIGREEECLRAELDDRMREDEELRRLMANEFRCREWWTINKEEWWRKRQELRKIEEELTECEDLEQQVKLAEEEAWQGQSEEQSGLYRPARAGWGAGVRQAPEHVVDEGLMAQIETLKRQRDECLPWFHHNRKLMRIVWHRAKEARETMIREDRASRARYPAIDEYPQVKDIRSLAWYGQADNGIEWWIGEARNDLASFGDAFQLHQDEDDEQSTRRARLLADQRGTLKWITDQIDEADAKADAEIYSVLDQPFGGYEKYIQQTMEDRYKAKQFQVQEQYNTEAMIKGLEKKEKEAKIIRKYQMDLVDRNRTFDHLLEEVSHPPIGPEYSMDRTQMARIFTDVYNLISIHIRRTRRVLKLLNRFRKDSDAFSETKSQSVISKLESHFPSIQTEKLVAFIEKRLLKPEIGSISYSDLHNTVANVNLEVERLMPVLDYCHNILDMPEITPEADPSWNTVKAFKAPDTKIVTFSQETPVYNPADVPRRTLGSDTHLGVARDVLEKLPAESHPSPFADILLSWHELIRDFFTSPDIFPLFRNPPGKKLSWTKKDFKAKVDNLLKTPLEPLIHEAFLVYCSHTNDLFRVAEFSRRVESLASGWELCEENTSIKGLYRKIDPTTYARPRDINYAEEWMKISGTYLGVGLKERRFSEAALREALNKYLPQDKRVSKRRMREYLRYWGLVGKFYVLVDSTENYEENEAPLIRIDAGFDIPPNAPFIPIDRSPRKAYRLIRDTWKYSNEKIEEMMEKQRRGERVTERFVYRILFLNGNIVGMNWQVSRHQFRLFLRWCSQRDGMSFKLLRGGEVRFLPSNSGLSQISSSQGSPSQGSPSQSQRSQRSQRRGRNADQRHESDENVNSRF